MRNEEINNEVYAIGCKMSRAYYILLGQLDTSLKEAGLNISTGEYLILRAVFSRDGLQQCEIADLVGKDKASVCRSVGALVKRGLLTTEAVSYKCQRVYATEMAREIEPMIMEVAHDRYEALRALANDEELNVYINILNRIIDSK